jgi:hypothetical protein
MVVNLFVCLGCGFETSDMSLYLEHKKNCDKGEKNVDEG